VTAQNIYDVGGQLIHRRGKVAGFPIMARSDIFAGGERVGHIEVREDFEPFLWRALALFLLSLGLGVLMYVGIHRLPISALDRTMTELEATYRQLEDHAETAALARDEADAASKAKTDFLANMSHELRTPLNAVLGFSDVMRMEMFGKLTTRYREYADNIHKSGPHLMKILNDILDLSRIEANKLDVSITLIDLRDVLTSCRQIIQPRVAEAGLTLEVALDDLPLAVHGDATRLIQVFLNLLSNAMKFTPSGGRIVVSTQVDDQEVSVIVRDSGIGMQSSDIPQALERFRQLGTASTRSHSGAGLGLPISKSLVDMHSGTLRIESAPGKGTSVIVALPLAVPQMLRKTA
jgi:signal transduction histidine kinase